MKTLKVSLTFRASLNLSVLVDSRDLSGACFYGQ